MEHSEGYQEYADEEGCQDSDWYDESQEYEDDSAYGDDEDYRDLPEEDYPLDEENEDIYEEDEAVYETEEEPQAELPVKKPVKSGRPVQTQERPVVRRETEQGSAKQDAQDDDFEIFDL